MELLNKLTQISAVSGNEERICEFITNEVKGFADEVYTDSLNNVIAVKKSKNKDAKKLMLSAHTDEIGIIVTYIEKDGFLRFASVGGISLFNSINKRVVFSNGTTGIVSYEEKIDIKKDLKPAKMYIDIGAQDFEKAASLVSVGDTAVFEGAFYDMNGRVSAKALDDRIGVYALIKAFTDINDTAFDIYAVFSSQEEIGLRGAKTAAYTIKPDYALAIDVTDTGDTPNCNLMDVKLGGGVCIKFKDNSIITHKKINDALIKCAQKNNIPFQREVLSIGGTDAGSIHLTRGGVVTGALSIPTRYIHSPCEVADVKDIKGCINLIKCFAKENYFD